MTEQESFNQIDLAIESFIVNEGAAKSIQVSKKPHSDLLVFNWRQLTWTEKEVNYLIEVYPTFDEKESVNGWHLYAAAYYDAGMKRFYTNRSFAESKTIDEIAGNAAMLLSESYQYLKTVKKEDIPFGTDCEY